MSLWLQRIAKIVKRNNKYEVLSEKGKSLGVRDTYEEALKRLRQVEYFKHNTAAKALSFDDPDTALLYAEYLVNQGKKVPHVLDVVIAENIDAALRYAELLNNHDLVIPEIIDLALSASSLYTQANIYKAAKIIPHASQEIPISKFNVSFNEMYKDYVIYFPGTVDQYVTRIGDVELGFGPRYLLKKLLYDVRKANPTGIVNTDYIEIRSIPELPEPLMRRLGNTDIMLITEKPEKKKLVRDAPNFTEWHASSDAGQADGTETGDERNYEQPNTGTQEKSQGQIL